MKRKNCTFFSSCVSFCIHSSVLLLLALGGCSSLPTPSPLSLPLSGTHCSLTLCTLQKSKDLLCSVTTATVHAAVTFVEFAFVANYVGFSVLCFSRLPIIIEPNCDVVAYDEVLSIHCLASNSLCFSSSPFIRLTKIRRPCTGYVVRVKRTQHNTRSDQPNQPSIQCSSAEERRSIVDFLLSGPCNPEQVEFGKLVFNSFAWPGHLMCLRPLTCTKIICKFVYKTVVFPPKNSSTHQWKCQACGC